MNKSNLLNRFFLLAIAGLIFTAVPNFGASAALVKCRADPVFTLSNGEKVTIVLDIDTVEANVVYVNYKVHVPPGVTLKNVVFTAGGIGQLETYFLVHDSQANTYTTGTFLLAKQSGVAVVATTSLSSKVMASIAGYSSQNLITTVSSATATTLAAKTSIK